MEVNTTAEVTTTAEAAAAVTTEGTDAAKADVATGIEVNTADTDLLAKAAAKAEADKVKEVEAMEADKAKNTVKADEKEKPKGKEVAKTAEELGYIDVPADQKALASLATDMGVAHDDILGAITDNKFDVTKLEGLSARDAQLLKNAVDVEISRLSNQRAERVAELHKYAGGEENFKQMVAFVNKEAATDPAFKEEVATLRNMMVEGGKPAELAVKALFEKFSAAPNTTLNVASEGSDKAATADSALSKRETLDKGWAAFKNKTSK